jgi:protocatechuate 3,4-dioxygenase beta subunit
MFSRPKFPSLRSTHASLGETLDVLARREMLMRRKLLLGSIGGAATLGLAPLRSVACTLIPAETSGPFPGDGTNGPNVLMQAGILRSDIRSSFSSAGSAVAAGTPLTVALKLVSTTSGCASLAGLAVYIWHCDATGGYSMYSSGVSTQNYLRGVQVTDAEGEVTFTTIWPGCYSGRWPHIHFEVYSTVAAAVSGTNAIRTSQLALPETQDSAVYAQTALYPGSTANLNAISLQQDMVFSDDGGVTQIPTLTGDNANGYVATLVAGIAATPSDVIFADAFGS